jgi:hypothetical protein
MLEFELNLTICPFLILLPYSSIELSMFRLLSPWGGAVELFNAPWL